MQRQQAAAGEPFQGSAVEWVLKKADQSLDEIEDNPPEYAKVIYDISTGPIGETGWQGLLLVLEGAERSCWPWQCCVRQRLQ